MPQPKVAFWVGIHCRLQANRIIHHGTTVFIASGSRVNSTIDHKGAFSHRKAATGLVPVWVHTRLYQKNPKIYHKNPKTDHKNPSDLDCSRLFYSALLRTFIAPDVPILSDVPPETHPPRKLFFIGVVESPVRSGWACQKIQKQYQINPKAIPN